MKTFCYLPWVHSSVRNDGTFRVCCQANVSPDRGELKDELGNTLTRFNSTISNAANSPTIKYIRKTMMNGEWPEQCVRCKEEEVHGGFSRRKREETNTEFMQYKSKDQLIAATSNDGTIDLTKAPISSYEIRLGNLCNLACVMCGPSDSSAWYDLHDAMWDMNYSEKHDVKSLAWYKEDSEFWDEFDQNIKNVKYLYIVGGEPLMTKRFYQILEQMSLSGAAQDAIIDFNTNLTVTSPKLLKLLSEFRSVQIGVSIDGVGPVNDYIRYPSKWLEIENNLKELDNVSSKRHNIRISATVSALNVMDIPNLIEWKISSEFENVNRSKQNPIITHHFCFKPRHANMQLLPTEVKHLVDQEYNNYKKTLQKYPDYIRDKIIKILESIQSYMWDVDNDDEKYLLIEFIKRLDKTRNTDISSIFPELGNYVI